MGVPRDGIGDAADKGPSQTPNTSAPHHHESRTDLLRQPQDRRVRWPQHEVWLHPLRTLAPHTLCLLLHPRARGALGVLEAPFPAFPHLWSQVRPVALLLHSVDEVHLGACALATSVAVCAAAHASSEPSMATRIFPRRYTRSFLGPCPRTIRTEQ